MNLYFVVEGRRTEKKIYAEWLSHVFPTLRLVQRAEDVTEGCLRVITGGGQPQYLERVAEVLEEIAAIVGNRVDRLFVCADAEDASFEERHREISEAVERLNPAIRFSVIVQNCCIETWLLGNRRFLKRNPEDARLRTLKSYYDVGELDPEDMEPMPPYKRKAHFHEDYLKAVYRERGLSYTKKNPYPATDEHYLKALVERFDQAAHIRSFGRLVGDWRDLGAEI